MNCRVCNESISFVKGSRPGKRKKASWAVHDKELSQVMEQTRAELVTPHPGNQRKLRQELEDAHRQGASAHQQSDQSAARGGDVAGYHNAGQGSPAASQSSAGQAGAGQAGAGQMSAGQSGAGDSQGADAHTSPTPQEEIPGAAAVNRPQESGAGGDYQQTRNAGA
jgi:type II secretory pathway component GspD/PulD (secretin)